MRSLKGGSQIHSYLSSNHKVNVLQEMEVGSGFHDCRTENSLRWSSKNPSEIK